MPPDPPHSNEQVTLVLAAIRAGDKRAGEQLLPLVYHELKALARARMAMLPPGNTLQPTALVHEAYLKLVGPDGAPDTSWESRAHFFGAAARAMRDIIVDQARRKGALKAGGDRKREDFDAAADRTPPIDQPPGFEADLLALDSALTALEKDDPRKAEVVMLKYFAGLEHEQIARALNVSIPTVERDWRFARSWLQKEIASLRKT